MCILQKSILKLIILNILECLHRDIEVENGNFDHK